MKNTMIYLVVFILILLNCTSKQIAENTPGYTPSENDELSKFFKICSSDIKEAVKVIADNKMIGMLTHLKKMDKEGRKYYLLERENLTAIIKSVTEKTYSDLILINSSGDIIYTMINDDIFGKNVKTHLKDTALNICFSKSPEAGFHIEDVSLFPVNNGTPKIFASYPDNRDNYTKGVFVIQIDIEIIKSLFKKIPAIIGVDGKYRIDKNMDNILKPYDFFNKINVENLNKIKKQALEIENNNYIYYPFNFNNLSWIIISEN